MHWGIVACTHLELIGWLNANLWHGFAAISLGELGAEIYGTNAEIHGIDSCVFFCFEWRCSGPLLDTDDQDDLVNTRATCFRLL